MTSQLKVDKLQGRTTAGSITVTSEGTSVETNLQQGLCKAWTVCDMGDNALDDSSNVSSLTDEGTGRFYLTFTNSFSSVSHSDGAFFGSNGAHIAYAGDTAKTASITGSLICSNSSNSAVDGSPYINVTSHGDLA